MKKRTSWNAYFDIGDDTIRVSGSYFSGRESIYVNEKKVSEKVNWTFKSQHKFSFAGSHYDVIIELLGIFNPQIRVQLLRQGDVIDEDYIFKNTADGKHQKLSFLISIVVFFLAGFASYWLVSYLLGS